MPFLNFQCMLKSCASVSLKGGHCNKFIVNITSVTLANQRQHALGRAAFIYDQQPYRAHNLQLMLSCIK